MRCASRVEESSPDNRLPSLLLAPALPLPFRSERETKRNVFVSTFVFILSKKIGLIRLQLREKERNTSEGPLENAPLEGEAWGSLLDEAYVSAGCLRGGEKGKEERKLWSERVVHDDVLVSFKGQ